MLLAVEIGNTNIKFGIFETSGAAAGTLVHTWRSVTNRLVTGDDLAAQVDAMLRLNGVKRSAVKRVAVASVVPPLYRAVSGMAQQYFNCRPEFLSAARQTIVPVKTRHAAELGADLIGGAIGAVAKYGPPLIVVQFGTATTFAAISELGEYLGTAIAPGIEVSADALIGRAAKLMDVPLIKPPAAIGTDTATALQSGIILGVIGQVEYLISLFTREMKTKPKVIATGGLVELIAPHAGIFDVTDERLVLDGLYVWAAKSARRARASVALERGSSHP